MPLVVPGITTSLTGGDDQKMEWVNKLMGKKLGDTTDDVNFAKKELPAQHRVIKEGEMSTMDHNPERLNVHVDDSNVIKKVTHG